ncbi:conserved Plasmodium protein, unknown function [Plasmodium gallinaceum]|uniref:Uncharacterized protein n=1 Tax=Plasmodium gallinaceum TaxID=5849 RepID=A0A1J1GYM8_PLAGA|nr:conserved Plasmodium protein, unknown function [Plasmodium gallinaceum]CRG96400.1 conserved Plasmodium protein, unknown function [Plasmodium gallinaceum]
MCEEVMSGFFYKDCNLYVGEYIQLNEVKKEDDLEKSKDEINKKKIDLRKEISKNIYDEKNLNKSNKKSEENDKEKNDNNDNINDNNIIFHGNGKYIKKNEIFVGFFENNMYRKGIWVKYKNIHNLFFYMNIHEMILKEGKSENIENFKNLLYLPLKEINIYIGEFDNNMFNGFSLYYFYPFLYVGYFVNNLMNGYGYIFFIESVNKTNYSKKNCLFSYNVLFDYLFERDIINEKENEKEKENKKEKEKEKEKENENENENEKNRNKEKVKESGIEKINGVNEKKSEKINLQKDKISCDINDSTGDDNLKRKLLFQNVYEKLEIMMKETHYKENNNRDNLIDKIEKDIYKNMKLHIKKKNRINKIKKILNENEKENFFDIFNYITYDNLVFKGFFYNNKFSNNANEQILYKNMFIQLYKSNIINKIDKIKNNILIDSKSEDLHISEHHNFYALEKKKKILLKKKKTDIKTQVKYDIKNNVKEDIKDLKENLKFENFKNIIDWTLLKNIFELTLNNNIEYIIDIVTDEKIFKYKNKFKDLNIEEKYLNEATLNLNGYYQLVVLNFKCKSEIPFNLNTNKSNFQNIYKIKIFLISSDKSSIINYNTFNLYYIFVYVRSLDKKSKNKIKKKKN